SDSTITRDRAPSLLRQAPLGCAQTQCGDQGVDCAVLDADEVAGARSVGSRRAPKSALLVAGRKALRPSSDSDVEIPLAQPVFILDGIDKAHAHAYPQALQRCLVGQRAGDVAGIVEQELDLHWFGRTRIDELHVL